MKLKAIVAAAATTALLAACSQPGTTSPDAGLSGCGDIQILNLPAIDKAVDAANDLGVTPPNGAIQLTKAQTAGILSAGKFLLSFKGSNPQDPQFENEVGQLGLLLTQIANPVQDGYVDNNQAPAVDRLERSLQGACGFTS